MVGCCSGAATRGREQLLTCRGFRFTTLIYILTLDMYYIQCVAALLNRQKLRNQIKSGRDAS